MDATLTGFSLFTFFSPLNHLHLPPRLTPSLVLSKLHPSTMKDAGASRECWCFLFMQLQEPGRTQSTQPHLYTLPYILVLLCVLKVETHQKRKLLHVKLYKEIECIWWFKTNNTISLLLYIYRSNKTAVKKKKVVGNFPQCWCSAKISTIFQQRCRMCK